jgi:hypothetical protein
VGDANEELDRWDVTPSQIIGKVALTIPYLGYAVDFAKTPKGFILFVIIPATIVIYEELKNLFGEIKKVFTNKKNKTIELLEEDKKETKEGKTSKALIFVPLLGACVVLIAFTKAYFFDNEKAEENTIGVSTNYGNQAQTQLEENTPTQTVTPTPTISITITP